LIERNSTSPKPGLTSNSFATALLWLCWVRAKYHGSDAGEMQTNTESRIITAVEVRDRIEPRLPSTYMGNALMAVETSTRIQELLPTITVDHETNGTGHLHPREIEQISRLAILLQDQHLSTVNTFATSYQT
jgi:hypothetical protein